MIATQRDATRWTRSGIPLLGSARLLDSSAPLLGLTPLLVEGPLHADELAFGRLAVCKLREDRVQGGVARERKVGERASAAAVSGAQVELAGAEGGADTDLRQPRRPDGQLGRQKTRPLLHEGRRAQRRQQAACRGRPMLRRRATGGLGALVRACEEASHLVRLTAVGDELGGEADLASGPEAVWPKSLVKARFSKQPLQQRRRWRRRRWRWLL